MSGDPAGNGVAGRLLIRHPVVDSTMDMAATLATGGAPHGTVVVAGEQTRGRGRLDRSWHAPAGSAVLASWILRFPAAMPDASALSLLVALAVARATIDLIPEAPVTVKWPNDVLLASRKVAGILLTARVRGPELVVIAGTGINVHSRSIPDDGCGASLDGWDPEVSVERMLDVVAGRLSAVTEGFAAAREIAPDDVEAIDALLADRGSMVTVRLPCGDITGEVRGIGANGALRLREPGKRGETLLRIGEIVRGPRPV